MAVSECRRDLQGSAGCPAGLTGTSQTYALADDTADSGLGRPNAALRIELESNRSGVISLQKHSVAFERAGYGLSYDKYYGGI